MILVLAINKDAEPKQRTLIVSTTKEGFTESTYTIDYSSATFEE